MHTSSPKKRDCRSARPRVEAMEARQLLATLMVVNTNDVGAGTLRQAILDANTAPGVDIINFAIPGAGSHIIQPLSPLPTITDPVTIDGFTQPGAHPNTLPASDDAVRLIGLDGNGLVGDGLHIAAGGSTVRGLAIGGFVQSNTNPMAGGTPLGGNGIFLDGASGNLIVGNALGLDVGGKAQGNRFAGLSILGSSSANTIGGPTPGARNILSGNDGMNVYGYGGNALVIGDTLSSTDDNVVQGNFIGTTPDGSAALGNTFGIEITGSARNRIGGTEPGARNVISGNGRGAVYISNNFQYRPGAFNIIQGNFIGTDTSGTIALGNGRTAEDRGFGIGIDGDNNSIGGSAPGAGNLISGNFGDAIIVLGHTSSVTRSSGRNNLIQGNRIGTDVTGLKSLGNLAPDGAVFLNRSFGNTVGGLAAGEGNTIAYNAGPGVKIGPSYQLTDGNVVLSNAITSNAGAGIDRFVIPPAPPVLTSATLSGGSTIVSGTLASTPSTAFTIQFFADGPEPAGPAEGRTLLGATTVSTDASGNASFTAALPGVLAPGEVVTATATNPAIGTSAFSGSVAYIADLAVVQSIEPGPITAGAELRITLTVSNSGPMTATGVVLTDTLPAGSAFVSASRGTYDPATNTLTAALGSLPVGGSTTVVLVIRPATAGTIFNTARVRGNESDPSPGDNAATISVSVAPDGPRVIGLRRIGNRLILTFSTPLNPVRARDLHNYVLVQIAAGGRREHKICLLSAAYNSAARSVVLRPAIRLDNHRTYRLTVRGDGHLGSDFLVTLPGKK